MKQLFFLFFAVTVLLACTKSKDDNNNTAITKENLAGSYRITSVKVNSIEVISQLEACQQDDILKLNVDNTAEFIDAGVKCSPPTDGTGTWDVSGNTLTLQGETLTIKSFDGSTLVAEGMQEVMGINVSAVITFAKQ